MVLVEHGREIGSDPRRDELLQPVLLRLFERSLDRVLLDPDLVDLVLIEQRLELAIGYRRVLLARLVEALHQHKSQDSGDDVPDIDLGLAILWIAKTAGKLSNFFRNADFSGSLIEISAAGLDEFYRTTVPRD